ncbi:MAG: hypothetical protein MJ072_03915, partial [Clostridia bacterium]|nr:hypothetical protein [Clostridia bacterium]
MDHCFNPLDVFCKSVTGALRENENCVFRLKGDYEYCNFLLVKDGGKPSSFAMQKRENYFEFILSLSETGLYFYSFEVPDGLKVGLGDDYAGVFG